MVPLFAFNFWLSTSICSFFHFQQFSNRFFAREFLELKIFFYPNSLTLIGWNDPYFLKSVCTPWVILVSTIFHDRVILRHSFILDKSQLIHLFYCLLGLLSTSFIFFFDILSFPSWFLWHVVVPNYNMRREINLACSVSKRDVPVFKINQSMWRNWTTVIFRMDEDWVCSVLGTCISFSVYKVAQKFRIT